LSFNRSFDPDEVQEWQEFSTLLANVSLSISMDKVEWPLDAKKVFSARSLYRFILNPSVRDMRMLGMWKANFPLNKKILWACFRGKVQSASQLALRGWPRNVLCTCCGVEEDMDHIIFLCPLAKFVWCVKREAFGKLYLPRCRDNFVDIFLTC
jgi:hypothetical protein